MYQSTKDMKQLFTLLNIIEIAGVALVLFIAIMMQFIFHELPCPLCLLQRVGFFGIILSLMMNLRYGFRPSHYALALLFALFTGFVALRQIALHVVPGTGAYGGAFLGLHLYTWSFLLSLAIIIYSTIVLGSNLQYKYYRPQKPKWQKVILYLLFTTVIILVTVNLITVYMECGMMQCPDNPTRYLL